MTALRANPKTGKKCELLLYIDVGMAIFVYHEEKQKYYFLCYSMHTHKGAIFLYKPVC